MVARPVGTRPRGGRLGARPFDHVGEVSASRDGRLRVVCQTPTMSFTAAEWVTDSVTVADEWEYRRDTNVLVGYRSSTAVTVTVHDIDRLAPLLRLAVGDASAQVRSSVRGDDRVAFWW